MNSGVLGVGWGPPGLNPLPLPKILTTFIIIYWWAPPPPPTHTQTLVDSWVCHCLWIPPPQKKKGGGGEQSACSNHIYIHTKVGPLPLYFSNYHILHTCGVLHIMKSPKFHKDQQKDKVYAKIINNLLKMVQLWYVKFSLDQSLMSWLLMSYELPTESEQTI